MTIKIFKLLGLVAFFSLFTVACSDDDDNGGSNQQQQPNPTIAAAVEADARFSILANALDTTGLTATFEGSGDFTVFAPTNAAFQALFSDLGVNDLPGLMAALPSGALNTYLKYHVLGEAVLASDVPTGYTHTLGENGNGNVMSLFVESTNGLVINGLAKVIETNIQASNGVIHAVNAVLQPLSVYGLVEVNANFSSLRNSIALADGNLDLVLDADTGSYTLFAPDNDAFDTLIANTPGVNDLSDLVVAVGTDGLANILLYHTLAGEYQDTDFNTGSINTLATDAQGNPFTFFINVGSSSVTVIDGSSGTDNADVTAVNMTGINGTVHFIDNVLLPQ